ncbi:hypothetical protein AAEX28_12065 [Lentisphaerota bacterium WC36G]|nr:hypothetical protein LJT99_14900 [Lentisphaerae bacterium WC36]
MSNFFTKRRGFFADTQTINYSHDILRSEEFLQKKLQHYEKFKRAISCFDVIFILYVIAWMIFKFENHSIFLGLLFYGGLFLISYLGKLVLLIMKLDEIPISQNQKRIVIDKELEAQIKSKKKINMLLQTILAPSFVGAVFLPIAVIIQSMNFAYDASILLFPWVFILIFAIRPIFILVKLCNIYFLKKLIARQKS